MITVRGIAGAIGLILVAIGLYLSYAVPCCDDLLSEVAMYLALTMMFSGAILWLVVLSKVGLRVDDKKRKH